MIGFLDYLKNSNVVNETNYSNFRYKLNTIMRGDAPREEANEFYYSILKGVSIKHTDELGKKWFEESKNTIDNFYIDSTLKEISRLKNDNVIIVIVTGSFRSLVTPLIDELHIDDQISAPLEIKNGRYTGHLTNIPTIGKGKSESIEKYCNINNIEIENCFAYGDDISDIPMLKAVGNPTLIAANQKTIAIAKDLGWKYIEAA